MDIRFSVKKRNPDTGEWTFVDVNDLAGKNLQTWLEAYVGKEVVAEFVFGEEKFFFTGTERWKGRMARKGKAVMFEEAAKILQERCPDLLNEVIPKVDTVAGIFEGCTLQEINFSGDRNG